MDIVAVVASVVLGVVFVLAGAAKLAARDAWPMQAVELGSPIFVAQLVPWAELAIGATLIAQVAKPIPALVAIWFLLVFTALIAKRLSEGRRPMCACFGTWSAKPIGPRQLARNAGLLLLGVLALLG